MEQLHTLKVCDTGVVTCHICGAEEPPFWFDAPMNETIREYSRTYMTPPKKFYPSLEVALDAWGIKIEPEEQ
jgi:hypothetical protein